MDTGACLSSAPSAIRRPGSARSRPQDGHAVRRRQASPRPAGPTAARRRSGPVRRRHVRVRGHRSDPLRPTTGGGPSDHAGYTQNRTVPLAAAEPADKTELHDQLGITVAHKPNGTVTIESRARAVQVRVGGPQHRFRYRSLAAHRVSGQRWCRRAATRLRRSPANCADAERGFASPSA